MDFSFMTQWANAKLRSASVASVPLQLLVRWRLLLLAYESGFCEELGILAETSH
jgi:hypothetical protein